MQIEFPARQFVLRDKAGQKIAKLDKAGQKIAKQAKRGA
jgi:hypothetical protein